MCLRIHAPTVMSWPCAISFTSSMTSGANRTETIDVRFGRLRLRPGPAGTRFAGSA